MTARSQYLAAALQGMSQPQTSQAAAADLGAVALARYAMDQQQKRRMDPTMGDLVNSASMGSGQWAQRTPIQGGLHWLGSRLGRAFS